MVYPVREDVPTVEGRSFCGTAELRMRPNENEISQPSIAIECFAAIMICEKKEHNSVGTKRSREKHIWFLFDIIHREAETEDRDAEHKEKVKKKIDT